MVAVTLNSLRQPLLSKMVDPHPPFVEE